MGNETNIIQELSNIRDITPMVITAIYSSEPASQISAIGLALASYMIKKAKEKLYDEKKVEPDFNNCGMELPFKMAQIGAGKNEYVRELWINAINKVIDPNYSHWVRYEDIELLEKLNPSDIILLFIIGVFRENMQKETKKTGIIHHLEQIKNFDNSMQFFIERCFHLNFIKDYFKTRFGQDLKIPDEELWYALDFNTAKRNNENKDKLFTNVSYIRNKTYYTTNRSTQITDNDYSANYAEGTLIVSLTEKGKRLLRIISDVNNIL
ncbi:MAG: hypothetical protein ACD_79C00193G0004 [uncultured bacterium]|nr:MAG: hypothetical protein ACD_79C00193G0004 [uncultured bacterium]